jgi:hypothetical protein
MLGVYFAQLASHAFLICYIILNSFPECIRYIKDPEHPHTLEDLNVLQEEWVHVEDDSFTRVPLITVYFTPTVPHCSLATMIGLCIRVKLQKELSHLKKGFKLRILVTEGSHSTEAEINKQVNDKERVAAAIENPALLDMVNICIAEDDCH